VTGKTDCDAELQGGCLPTHRLAGISPDSARRVRESMARSRLLSPRIEWCANTTEQTTPLAAAYCLLRSDTVEPPRS